MPRAELLPRQHEPSRNDKRCRAAIQAAPKPFQSPHWTSLRRLMRRGSNQWRRNWRTGPCVKRLWPKRVLTTLCLGAAVDAVVLISDRRIRLHFSRAFDCIGVDPPNKRKLHLIRAEACAHLAQEGFIPFSREMMVRPVAHSVSEDQQHQK